MSRQCLLDAGAINSSLKCKAAVEVYQTIDSTNAELRRRLASFPPHSLDSTVIIASGQTAGRGRGGRAFASPAGAGVYLSLLHSPKGGIASPQIITATASVAVCRAIETVYGKTAQIKWVNDIFINGRKVCGILTEGIAEGIAGGIDEADGGGETNVRAEAGVTAVIIGIGVNILPGALPKELQGIAGTVLDTEGADPKVNAFAAAIIEGVYSLLDEADDTKSPLVLAAIAEYKERSILTGRQVEVHPLAGSVCTDSPPLCGTNAPPVCASSFPIAAVPYSATVLGITDDASLIVRTEDGKKKVLNSGEVTLVSAQVAHLLHNNKHGKQ